ncbi:MAG TPA: hypothetical protein VIV40_38025 [Kofleriaceae bacterium]
MPRRASHRLKLVTLPPQLVGEAPPIVLDSVGFGDVDRPEQDRIDREGEKGNRLIDKAKPAQLHLLERLAASAGDQGVRFRSIAVLEAFLSATRALTITAAKALADDKLAALWRDAEAKTPAKLRDAAPEPELLLHFASSGKAKQKLALEVVGRVGPAPKVPDRVAQEAQIGSFMIGKASLAQSALLERLVRAAGPDGLRFAVVSTLAKFFAVTRTLTPSAAAKLSDDQIAKLWQEASSD